MARRPKVVTPEHRVADVLRWAERQGFENVAADLRQALADLNLKTRPPAR